MSRRVKKLSPQLLRKMIIEEAQNLKLETLEQGKDDPEKVNAEEVDADALAGSLEKDVDYLKALKIHEERLMKRVRQIREAKKVIRRRAASKI